MPTKNTNSNKADSVNLQQVMSGFHSVEIDQKGFLISKNTGEVQSINHVASLFIELAKLGSSNHQIIDDISQVLAVEKQQVEEDLNRFCFALENIQNSGKIDDYLDSEEDEGLLSLDSFKLVTSHQTPVTHRYIINQLLIDVSYPSTDVAQLSHAILLPMVSTNEQATTHPSHSIVIDQGSEGYLMTLDDKPLYYINQLNLIANYLRTSLINLAGAAIDNWLSIHAAAISDNTGQAILFAAPSGSGKSTLSLELCSKNADYLGDDMLMIDLDQKKLIPFTTSVNLKPGAWPLFSDRYKDLSSIPTLQEETRPVKYLPLSSINKKSDYSVTKVVFPTYNPEGSNRLERLKIEDVIHLLSESGCYSAVAASVSMSKKYLEFFLGLDAYKLDYCSSEEAIQLLKENRIVSI